MNIYKLRLKLQIKRIQVLLGARPLQLQNLVIIAHVLSFSVKAGNLVSSAAVFVLNFKKMNSIFLASKAIF
jgi:hypothetical protein